MKNYVSISILIIIFWGVFLPKVSAQNHVVDNSKPYLNLWILIQNDVIYDLKQMDPDWIGGFRPSKIPVYPTDPGWGTNGHLYYSIRPSTFKFEGVIPVKNSKWGPIRLRVEFDLFGMGVHAGETTIRFRQAYGDWGPFRIGKDWSTFIDLEAFPNIYDWWGPCGMALLPSPVIRYTQKLSSKDQMEFALELPGNDVDPGYLRNVDPSLIDVKPKEIVPDFITRYTHRGKFGYVKAALLLRLLEYETISIQQKKAAAFSRFGWAVNLTTGINTFHKRGRLKLQTVFGHGYAGYNNDGGVELAPDANLHGVVPFQYGFVAFYDFNISKNKKWQASLGYSETHYDNSEGQLRDAFAHSNYSVTQLIYNIIPGRLLTGLNFQYGTRFNKDGSHANDQRLLFNVTFLFNHVRD